MARLYPYVTLHTINLKYFGNINLIEKIRVIDCIIGILLSKGYSQQQVSYWLGIPVRMLSSVIKGYKSLKPLLSHGWCKNDIQPNVHWFEKHQCPVNLSQQDEDYITELISLPISASQIARGALIKRPIISYLRTGMRTIDNLSLATIRRLVFYYNLIKKWSSWKAVIKDNYDFSCGAGALNEGDIDEQIGFYKQDHIFTKKSIKELKDSHTSWELFIYGNAIDPRKESGIAVDENSNDHILTLKHPSSDAVKNAKLYAHIDYRIRNFASTNATFIRFLLDRKYKNIMNLKKEHLSSKEIARKLKLNKDFVDLVINHEINIKFR